MLLKKRGEVFLSEANPFNPLVSISLFMQRGFNTLIEIEDENGNKIPFGNERIISHFSLQKAFSANGFKSVGVKYYRLLPNIPFLINNFYFLEYLIPKWIIPIYSHYKIGFKKIN